MEKIHNLYISSSNKYGNDTNYNYNLYLSHYNINIQPDEEAYFNINTFQTLNSFYNINNKSNTFTIKVKTDMDVSFTYDVIIDDGNYDIYQFMEEINKLAGKYINITYNEKKNKYRYTSTQPINNEVFIKPTKYNSKYFGLYEDVYTEILTEQVQSDKYSNIINMNNFSLIIIKVIGLVEQNKSIDNFNTTINKGDTTAVINRQDVSINALINWVDINKSFIKKINNNEINQLNFQIYNEYNDLLYDLNDWLLCFQIIIKKKPNYTLGSS